MPRLTLKEKYIRYLTAFGFESKPSRSKWIKMENKDGKVYWIGKNGAIRMGQKKTSSVDISRRIRPAMEDFVKCENCAHLKDCDLPNKYKEICKEWK